MTRFEIIPLKTGTLDLMKGFEIHIKATEKRENEIRESYVSNLTLTTLTEGEEPHDSCIFKISDKDAQALVNKLWEYGVRPSLLIQPEQAGAIVAHLNDMRKLVGHVILKDKNGLE